MSMHIGVKWFVQCQGAIQKQNQGDCRKYGSIQTKTKIKTKGWSHVKGMWETMWKKLQKVNAGIILTIE